MTRYIICVVFCFCTVVHADQTTIVDIRVTTTTENGMIDWTVGTVTAAGQAVDNGEGSIAQRKALARRGAIVDAYRRMTELVSGVRVDAETLMRDLMVANDDIRAAASGFVQGATIVDGSEDMVVEQDGSLTYTLSIQAPLGGLTSIVYSADRDSFGTEIRVQTAAYTAIVVDCTDLQEFVNPAMYCKLYAPDGNVIYAPANIDLSYASASKVATYVSSVIDAKRRLRDRESGADSNVLVVKATRRLNATSIEVSAEDAVRIIQCGEVLRKGLVAIVTR